MKHLGFVLIVLLLISSGSSLAAQSADQGQIVFSTDLDGDFEIYALDVASGDLRQITDNPATDLNPVWSPDGQRILFQSDRDGSQEIYVMQADGSQVQRLTNDPGDDTIPAWSPDGRWIVFSSDRDGDFEIYVMEADGSHVQPLTVNPTTQDSQPVWAPDGSRVYYTRTFADGTTCVATIQADGSGAHCLGPLAAQTVTPIPAPDGRTLAIARVVDSSPQVHLLDLATGSIGPSLTPGAELALPIAWSPDGQSILYAERAGEDRYLIVVGLDGSNPTRIANVPHIGVRGDWSAQAGVETPLAELPTTEDETAYFTPGELTVYDDDHNGVPKSYAYTFAPVEPVPGVELVQVAALMADSQEGAVVLVATNTTDQPQHFQHILDIPKSFAAHVNDLGFLDGLPKVIDPDPVVIFDISTDPNSTTTITTQSYSVQADGQDLASVMNVFYGFEYERLVRSCDGFESIDRARCYRSAMLNFPNQVTEADCANISGVTDDFGNSPEDWYLACRAIVTRDGWECTRLDSHTAQENCANDVYTSLRSGCRYLTDEPEAACLLDAAVTAGLTQACAEIPANNPLYRATCEAQIAQDPARCVALADDASRQACCEAFAGTALYSQCTAEPASGGGAVVQAEGPVREGIYEVNSTSTGTLYDGETRTDHFYAALKVCDGGARLDYGLYENNPADIAWLCVRSEDQYYHHFWQVSPGVYERVTDNGVSTLTVDSLTALHYYDNSVYAGGYTSFTEMWFTWYSALP